MTEIKNLTGKNIIIFDGVSVIFGTIESVGDNGEINILPDADLEEPRLTIKPGEDKYEIIFPDGNYLGEKGEKFVIDKTGSGESAKYYLINSLSPHRVIDIYFDSEKDAEKYAKKRGLIIKSTYEEQYVAADGAEIVSENDIIDHLVNKHHVDRDAIAVGRSKNNKWNIFVKNDDIEEKTISKWEKDINEKFTKGKIVHKTIAFSANKRISYYNGELTFQNIKNLTGITPVKIEHIKYLESGKVDPFIKWSVEELKNKFGVDVKNIIVKKKKLPGEEVEIISAFGATDDEKHKFKYSPLIHQWWVIEGDLLANGGGIGHKFTVREHINGEDKESGFDTYEEAKIMFDQLVIEKDYINEDNDWAFDPNNEDNWIEIIKKYADGDKVDGDPIWTGSNKQETEITLDNGTVFYIDEVPESVVKKNVRGKISEYQLVTKGINLFFLKNVVNDESALNIAATEMEDIKQPSENDVKRAMILKIGYEGFWYSLKAGGESQSDSLYSSSLSMDMEGPGGEDVEKVIIKKFNSDFKKVLITGSEIRELKRKILKFKRSIKMRKDEVQGLIDFLISSEARGKYPTSSKGKDKGYENYNEAFRTRITKMILDLGDEKMIKNAIDFRVDQHQQHLEWIGNQDCVYMIDDKYMTEEKCKEETKKEKERAHKLITLLRKLESELVTSIHESPVLAASNGATIAQRIKIGKTMHEFKEGKLHDSHGNIVTDRSQAIAIALSKAGLSRKAKHGSKLKDEKTPYEFGDVLKLKDIQNINQGDILGFTYKEGGKTTYEDFGQVDFFDENDKWRGFHIDGWPFEFETSNQLIENASNPEFELRDIENSGTYWTLYLSKKTASDGIYTKPDSALKFYRQANKTETKIIIDNFGKEWVPIIEMFLDDIVDIYPYEQWNRDTNGFKYKTIGASKRQQDQFYLIGEDGNIYMRHAFSLFPSTHTKADEGLYLRPEPKFQAGQVLDLKGYGKVKILDYGWLTPPMTFRPQYIYDFLLDPNAKITKYKRNDFSLYEYEVEMMLSDYDTGIDYDKSYQKYISSGLGVTGRSLDYIKFIEVITRSLYYKNHPELDLSEKMSKFYDHYAVKTLT